MKRTESSTSSSSGRPVAPLPTKAAAATQDGKPSSSSGTSAKKEAGVESPGDGSLETTEVNPALPTIVLPYPSKPRTYASDKAANAGTGDSIRDKSVELIYTSLASDSRADRAVLLEKAKLVEKGFYNAVGTKTDDAYRSKIRGVILNLKDKSNPALRDGIVRGEIAAIGICNMSKEVRPDRTARGGQAKSPAAAETRHLAPFAGHGEREPASLEQATRDREPIQLARCGRDRGASRGSQTSG